MRRLVTLSGLLAILVLATSAFAGGAVWEFEGYHRPGDIVVSTTAVAWGHNSSLGTPEDGPYLIYLAHADPERETWPRAPEEGLLVGIVEVHEGPFTGPEGDPYGPHHAVARFEIPDVPAGIYQIFHCNDPCTSTLGDIVGGWDLRVIGGEDGRSAEVIAEEVRARAAAAPLLIPAASATTGPAADDPPAVAPIAEAAIPFGAAVPTTTGETVAAAPEVHPPAGELGIVPARVPLAEVADASEDFDGLWQIVVAVVALLLVGRMLRTELGRRRDTSTGAQPGNEKQPPDEAASD